VQAVEQGIEVDVLVLREAQRCRVGERDLLRDPSRAIGLGRAFGVGR